MTAEIRVLIWAKWSTDMPTVTFRETAGQSNGHADKFANRYKTYGHPTDTKHITAGQSNGHPNGHLRTRPQRTRPPLLIGRSGPGLTPKHPPEIRSLHWLDRSRIVIDVTAHATPENLEGARDRDSALASYREHGLAEATRRTGVPKSTLRRWARDAGLNPAELAGANAERTAAAVAASTARSTELRVELRERFLETAELALERLSQPYVEFRGKDAEQVTYAEGPPASAFQAFVVAAATALDKFRLEAGEATELHGIAGDASEVESMRDELGKRRLARAS